MAESAIKEDEFLIQHEDFTLKEEVTYPNGGTSRFYENGVDMVIIDNNICDVGENEAVFSICSLLISRIITCISIEEFFVS